VDLGDGDGDDDADGDIDGEPPHPVHQGKVVVMMASISPS
jgi:hypothetical protein